MIKLIIRKFFQKKECVIWSLNDFKRRESDTDLHSKQGQQKNDRKKSQKESTSQTIK